MIDALLKTVASLGLLMLLAACGSSPPSQFYRLTPGNGSPGSEQQPSLGVGPVEIPEFLNRSGLAYTRGENRLHVSGKEIWAEPLAEGVQRVVGLNLAQLLNTENLNYFPWDTRHQPEYGVRISVLDLDADAQQATLTADWLLYRPATGEIISKRISQHTKPLSTGTFAPSELPPVYSALLYQLSETIAAAIREEQQKATEDQDQP